MVFEKQHQIVEPKLAPALLYGIAVTDIGKSNPWQEAAVHALLGVANRLRSVLTMDFQCSLSTVDNQEGDDICIGHPTPNIRSMGSVIGPQVYYGENGEGSKLGIPEKIRTIIASLRQHQDLLARARAYNTATEDVMGQTSQLHRQVSKFFTMVGLRHRNEVVVGPYSIDVSGLGRGLEQAVISVKILVGESFAFEVDGPHHFYRDTSMRTASSLLKHRILEALGFTVIRVPYQEWSQCGRKTLGDCQPTGSHLPDRHTGEKTALCGVFLEAADRRQGGL